MDRFPRQTRLLPILAATGIAVAAVLFFRDARTGTLLRNTLLLSGATCAVALPVGTVVGWLLVRTDLPGRKVALLLFGVMLLLPLYLHAAAWQAGFGIQGSFTLGGGVPFWLDGWTATIWIHAIAALPWVVLIAGAGFWLVEPELEEQAILDGSLRQVFFRVTLPGAAGAVGVAALWVGIVTAGEMTVTDLFSVRTYAEEVYTQLQVGPQPGDPPLGVASGVLLVAGLVGAGLLLVARLVPGDRPVSARRRLVFPLGRLRIPLAIGVAAGLLVVVGVPLLGLCAKAGMEVSQVDGARLRVWSAGKCVLMVATSPWRHRWEYGWSLAIGSIAATLAALAALVLGWMARRGRVRELGVLGLVAVCLAVPGPLVGLAGIRLLNRPEFPPLFWLYDQSILAPVLVLSMRSLAPATLILWHAMRTLPSEMLDAAVVDGAGPVALLVRVGLPCRRWAVALAWLVAFVIALGDLAAVILVVPPGIETLSIRIFGLLHYGVEDQVAGICLFEMVGFACIAAGLVWVARRWQEEIRTR